MKKLRGQELCESGGGCPGHLGPNSLNGLCGCKDVPVKQGKKKKKDYFKVTVLLFSPGSKEFAEKFRTTCVSFRFDSSSFSSFWFASEIDDNYLQKNI